MQSSATRANEKAELSILDWIGVCISFGVIVLLCLFPIAGKVYEAMYADFGDDTGLPNLTQLVLTGWFPLTLAAAATITIVSAFRRGLSRTGRRLSVLVGFLIAACGVAACVLGLYLPIFQMADAIRQH